MARLFRIWLLFQGILLIFLAVQMPSWSQDNKTDPGVSANSDENILPSDLQTREDYLPEDSAGGRGGLGFSYWINLILSIAIVIGLIYAFSYVFKILLARLPIYKGRDDFKVLSSLRISTQASLYIIRFGDEVFLLGVTPQNINVISKTDDPEKVHEIIETMSEDTGAVNPHAFSTMLGKRMRDAVQGEEVDVKRKAMAKDQRHFEDTTNRLKNFEEEKGKDKEWRA